VDPAADRLWVYAVDHEGGHMDRRQPQDIHTTLYSNQIGPGAARVVHYRLRVPEDARGAIALSAGVHYRKFTRDYTSFSLGAASPSLPVTTLAEDRVVLPIRGGGREAENGKRETKRGNPDKPWLRWNDYGIGLFLQGDLKGAARAWTRVAELAPDKPDGPLNRARAEIAEGRLADATESLALAEKIRPGWGKTAFFRSIVARDEGRLDDAERDLEAVLAKFPLDRVAWNSLGGILWLGGRFPEAVEAYGKTLAIDPEDLNAHYNLMRVYRAMGDRRRAAVHAAAYRKHKEDETGRAVAADLRRRDPWTNRESLPIHVHEEATPPPATAPAWVAALGPKGYQTDLGYLTRVHPPIRREAVEPAVGPQRKKTSYAPAAQGSTLNR
jgi:Flp pilus assembly protein TadD